MKFNTSMQLYAFAFIYFLVPVEPALAEPHFEITCTHLEKLYVYEFQGKARLNFVESGEGRRYFQQFTSANAGNVVSIVHKGTVLLKDHVYSSTEYIPSIPFSNREASDKTARDMCPSLLAVSPVPPPDITSPMNNPEALEFPAFQLSCKDIATIEIIKKKSTIWWENTFETYYYLVIIRFAPDVGEKFMRFVKSSPELMLGEDHSIPKKYVQLSAHGKRMRSDAPLLDGLSKAEVILTKRTLEGSLEIAHTLCSAKAPLTMRVERTIGIESVPLPER